MTVTDKLIAASLADAQAWAATPEKFIFCIDYLEISARQRSADITGLIELGTDLRRYLLEDVRKTSLKELSDKLAPLTQLTVETVCLLAYLQPNPSMDDLPHVNRT